MDQNIHLLRVSALDDMVKALESLKNASDRSSEEMRNWVSKTASALKKRQDELKNIMQKWEKRYQEWLSKIETRDDDGNVRRDPHAEAKAREAKEKIEQCKSLIAAAGYHLQPINDLRGVPLFRGINSKHSPATNYLRALRGHAGTYLALGNAGFASSVASAVSSVIQNAQNTISNKVLEFDGRKVLTRNINWNGMHQGKTNLEWALAGKSPFDESGSKIILHHIGQNVNGTLVEVPCRLHCSKQYNLHRMYKGSISFRRDRTLEHEYNKFRNDYWEFRAQNYLNGGER